MSPKETVIKSLRYPECQSCVCPSCPRYNKGCLCRPCDGQEPWTGITGPTPNKGCAAHPAAREALYAWEPLAGVETSLTQP